LRRGGRLIAERRNTYCGEEDRELRKAVKSIAENGTHIAEKRTADLEKEHREKSDAFCEEGHASAEERPTAYC
jgi:hypothetical protein